MTRFARAKGSKASNEKLPESPTSWSEMKQELLNKNKELEEKKSRELFMQQRKANYQAFLHEKEEEEINNTSWADFPEAKRVGKQATSKKHKLNSDIENKNTGSSLEHKKFESTDIHSQENGDDFSEDSDEEFSALKAKLDTVLAKQEAINSDSDAPPEEAGVKEEPQEIVIKKAKKPKQKLQILMTEKDKSNRLKGKVKIDSKKQKDDDEKEEKIKKENLSDKEKMKIEKKQERYKKQLEKKKLKWQEKNKKKSDGNMENSETVINDKNDFVSKKESSNLDLNEIDVKKVEKKLERRKKQKEKKLKKKQEAGLTNTLEDKKEEHLTEKDLAKIQKKKERRGRQAEKRKKFRETKALAAAESAKANEEVKSDQHVEEDEFNNFKNSSKHKDNVKNILLENSSYVANGDQNQDFTEKKPYQKLQSQKEKKEKKVKLKDNKNIQRKKSKTETMFINGKTIEIDYVDGFPVKKEDADRLKKLRKEMISKGLPRSEINIALKLERRRAEKAFAREKKNVCFNCRKSGHNLSECPELGKDQVAQTSGTGICFKCGSTEHTHFECKVVKGLDYKFATCFICKEQGHISRQCPDNQRGLYPKGGACKVCGDVTHLKKDCPKYQAQQSQLQASLSIETMDNRNPDDIGSKWEAHQNFETVKRPNKKIKF